MLSGRRRPCLVLFQSFTETDGQWGKTKAWVNFSQAWVSIEPERGREQFTQNEREAISTHVVRGDYYDLAGISPTFRMIYSPGAEYAASPSTIPDSALVYDILAVMPAHDQKSDVMLKVEQEGRSYGEITG